jgi:hypothetical protein
MLRIGSIFTVGMLLMLITSPLRLAAPTRTAGVPGGTSVSAVQLLDYLDPASATWADSSPVPAVSSVDVWSTWGLLGHTVGASVPLVNADCSQLSFPPDMLVGYVQAPSGLRAQVRATCGGSGDPAQINLAFPGLADTGATYTGDIKIGAAQVAISVQRTSSTFLPLVALAAGMLLALFLLKRGPARVISALRSRLRLAQAAIGSQEHPGQAVTAFRQAAGSADWKDLDLSDDAARTAHAIDHDITNLRNTRWFSLAADDPAVTALSQRIAALERVGPDLATLAKDLCTLGVNLPVVEASRLVSAWTRDMRVYLGPVGSVTLEEFSGLIRTASEAAAVAVWFPAVAQQVRSAENRLAELSQNQTERPVDERLLIASAQGLFDAALAAFGRAASSADVRAAYNNEFTTARRAVDELGSLQVLAAAGVAAAPAVLPQLLSMSLPTPEELEHQARVIVATERRASAVAVIVVGGLLLFTGLQALVIGKTFGTLWDFAAAVAWGSATLAVTSPLAAAIEGYQATRSSPE